MIPNYDKHFNGAAGRPQQWSLGAWPAIQSGARDLRTRLERPQGFPFLRGGANPDSTVFYARRRRNRLERQTRIARIAFGVAQAIAGVSAFCAQGKLRGNNHEVTESCADVRANGSIDGAVGSIRAEIQKIVYSHSHPRLRKSWSDCLVHEIRSAVGPSGILAHPSLSRSRPSLGGPRPCDYVALRSRISV